MARKYKNELKPFISILMIVASLFLVVFFKMEVRRQGYSALKRAREYRVLKDRYRLKALNYAKSMSLGRLRQSAMARLDLKEAGYGQIIQLSGKKIALRQ